MLSLSFLYFSLGSLLFIRTARALNFHMDENVTEMCFLLRGEVLGKVLNLEYEVIGDGRENVKFTLMDLKAKEELIAFDRHNITGRRTISQNINYKHDFRICWKNLDSEYKEVSFYHQHKSQVTVLDKGSFTRRRLHPPEDAAR